MAFADAISCAKYPMAIDLSNNLGTYDHDVIEVIARNVCGQIFFPF